MGNFGDHTVVFIRENHNVGNSGTMLRIPHSKGGPDWRRFEEELRIHVSHRLSLLGYLDSVAQLMLEVRKVHPGFHLTSE
jgi:hypothetical protein